LSVRAFVSSDLQSRSIASSFEIELIYGLKLGISWAGSTGVGSWHSWSCMLSSARSWLVGLIWGSKVHACRSENAAI